MSDEADKPNEISKPAAAAETILRGAVIKNQAQQENWREVQQHHMLEQEESATDIFFRPGTKKEASQKFELYDSSQEPILLASNIVPGSASTESVPQLPATTAEADAIIAHDFKQDYQGLRNLGLGTDVVRMTSPGSDRLIFPYRGTEDSHLAECTIANPAAWSEAFQAFPELVKYLSAETASKLMKALVRNELHNYDVKDRMGDEKSHH